MHEFCVYRNILTDDKSTPDISTDDISNFINRQYIDPQYIDRRYIDPLINWPQYIDRRRNNQRIERSNANTNANATPKFFFDKNLNWTKIWSGPDLFTSGLFLRLKLGLPVGLAGAEGPNQLTQLATSILTSKIGLGDESGPDIRWWENGVITPG
jgi:hypothetical protein